MEKFDIYLLQKGFHKPGRIPSQCADLAMDTFNRYADETVRQREGVLSCWVMPHHHNGAGANCCSDALSCVLVGGHPGRRISQAHRLINIPKSLLDLDIRVPRMRNEKKLRVNGPLDDTVSPTDDCDMRTRISIVFGEKAKKHATRWIDAQLVLRRAGGWKQRVVSGEISLDRPTRRGNARIGRRLLLSAGPSSLTKLGRALIIPQVFGLMNL